MRTIVFIAVVAAVLLGAGSSARAEWKPRDVVPSTASIAAVLAVHARALGESPPAERRERWTYVNGGQRLTVDVAVRGDDFRTSLVLGGLTYFAGRTNGARWRADGNGVAHGVQADLQGDALDSAPQALFTLDAPACSLIGEARLAAPAWVIQTHPGGDKPALLYIDEASGNIVREVLHDGRRIITTDFDRFEPFGGGMRARHWRVDDGIRANALDVTVDALENVAVSTADLAIPARRVLMPPAPLAASVDLDAQFRGESIFVGVDVDGKRRQFVLDTGTTSITVDRDLAARYGGTTLDHAVLPSLAVGPVRLDRVGVLSVPEPWADILGLDFFFGHVIEIDYGKQRVRILNAGDAQAAFADPRTTTLAANVDQGLPLVPAAFGSAGSDEFALDTGSPRLYVMRTFANAYAAEIRTRWTSTGPPYLERYLEGGIEIQGYTAPRFSFAGAYGTDINVGVQIPTKETDDLDIPFAGIIGTDVLSSFDLIIDYDNGRIGFRR